MPTAGEEELEACWSPGERARCETSPEHREQDLIEGSERRTGEGLQQIQDQAGEYRGHTSPSNFDHEGDDQEPHIPTEPNRHKATIKVDQSS